MPPAQEHYPPHEKKRIEHEEKVRAMFNRFALSGGAAEMQRQHQRVAEKLIRRIPLTPGDSVLELGCGDGWLTRKLAQICTSGAVLGIDVSDEMIDLARSKSVDDTNLMYAVGAAEEIPWAEDYFTRVVSLESAFYWFAPEKAIGELYRVTAHGGQLYLLMSYYRENEAAHHWQDHVDFQFNLMSAEEWAELLKALGFQNVQTDRIHDDTPIPQNFEPDVHWRSREEKENFQKAGFLLLTATKPDLPPPGPIEPLKEKTTFKIYR